MELKKASVKVLDKIAVPLLLRCSLDLFKLFSVITFLSLISSRLLSTHKVFRCLFTCATFFRYLSFLTIIKCITLTFIKEYQLKKNFTTTRRHFTTTRRLSPLTVKIWFNLVVFKFLNGEFCRLYLCLVEVNWAPYHTVGISVPSLQKHEVRFVKLFKAAEVFISCETRKQCWKWFY